MKRFNILVVMVFNVYVVWCGMVCYTSVYIFYLIFLYIFLVDFVDLIKKNIVEIKFHTYTTPTHTQQTKIINIISKKIVLTFFRTSTTKIIGCISTTYWTRTI